MRLSKFLLSIFITVLMFVPALGQTDEQFAQLLQNEMANVQAKYQQTQQMYELAQMGGSAADFRRLELEQRLHNWMYEYLQSLWQNPAPLRTSQGAKQFRDRVMEYDYRFTQADYRPYEQIQGQIQAYTQQQVWTATTPEGQRAFQQNQQAAQSSFEQSQANVRANSQMRDANQEAFVNSTIWENSQWNDPNTGETYLVPHSYEQPYIQGTDGYYYQMTPGNY